MVTDETVSFNVEKEKNVRVAYDSVCMWIDS